MDSFKDIMKYRFEWSVCVKLIFEIINICKEKKNIQENNLIWLGSVNIFARPKGFHVT